MNKSLVVGAITFSAAVAVISAKDFPFEFKILTAKDVMTFPGGYGAYGDLTLSKPAALKKAPAVVSAHPLFGQLREDSRDEGPVYRLDESGGDGKGYDRLLLDLNGNGDLTDDPVISRATGPDAVKTLAGGRQQVLFGPLAIPRARQINDWPMIYFGQLYIYDPKQIKSAAASDSFIGNFQLKAGWYLETLVELDGIRQKLGLVDGNANLRLGDPWQPFFYTNRTETFWYFRSGDSYLLDADGSGKFDSNPFGTEQMAPGPLLYFGAVPCKTAVAPDFKSVRVEPWTGPLAEVAVQPQGNAVRNLVLAWKRADNDWQLIEPGAVAGKVRVPPGSYRFYASVLAGKSKAGDPVMVNGYYRGLDRAFTADAAKPVDLRVGAPLEAKITMEQEQRRFADDDTGFVGTMGRLFGTTSSAPVPVLRISARVVGIGGESYSTFAKGRDLTADPPKPTFTVKDKTGKKVGSGSMEYG